MYLCILCMFKSCSQFKHLIGCLCCENMDLENLQIITFCLYLHFTVSQVF